jgi:hypothetical protein
LKVNNKNGRIQDPDSGSGSISQSLRGMDPRIRINTKMSWIQNTGRNSAHIPDMESADDPCLDLPLTANYDTVRATHYSLDLTCDFTQGCQTLQLLNFPQCCESGMIFFGSGSYFLVGFGSYMNFL